MGPAEFFDHYADAWGVGTAVVWCLSAGVLGAWRPRKDDWNVSLSIVAALIGAFWPLALGVAVAIGVVMGAWGLGWLLSQPYHIHKRKLATTKARLAGQQTVSR